MLTFDQFAMYATAMPAQAHNVRRAAVSALRAWAKGHIYMDSLVERHAAKNGLSRQDRALLHTMVYAVLRHQRALDFWIGKLRRGKLDHETRDILRVGLCQLLILGIADHAAVNETVNCAKASVRGLINAVLRQAIARRDKLMDGIAEQSPAVRLSHPDWLWGRWKREFGRENTVKLFEWNNTPAVTIGRVNPLVADALETVEASEVASPVDGLPGFFTIEGAPPGEWMKRGLLYIQDPATRHCVELLDPQPGEVILDACAAPGGKAALIAAAMENKGSLCCTDSNEKRLPRLEHNLTNLGVNIAEVAEHDWTEPAPKDWLGKFDAILLDVPCSNTGVFRRRVDARWRLRAEAITDLRGIQLSILNNALPCLKLGGRMVYSTCSIEAMENSELIAEFLTLAEGMKVSAERQITPFEDGTDGAYAALLVKDVAD